MDNLNYIVRYDGKIKFESYIKGIGWHENPNRVDITMGENPFLKELMKKTHLKL